jgi:hypothetical protein
MKNGLSVIVGTAMIIASGVASADEPMQLTAAEMDGVTAGCYGCGTPDFSFTKEVVTVNVATLDVWKLVVSQTYVVGNLADAEATAQAFGPGSLAETVTVTYTDGGSSVAYSGSVSATN